MQLEELLAMLEIDGLDAWLGDLDGHLLRSVGTSAEPMASAVRRVSSVPGKRLRPIFTLVCSGSGSERSTVTKAAAAIELVQIGSLVHDDLFEEAEARRAVPTINHVEGNSVALLAGDFILAKAAVLAAGAGQQVAQLLARTVCELCEGQLREMRDQNNPDRGIDDYLASLRGKTGVLFAAACRAGVYAAGGDELSAVAFANFGEQFGMAFQLLDDVLDFVGDPVRLMKPIGIDLETGVYTLPVLLALSEPGGAQLRALLRRATPDDLVAAREFVLRSGTIHATISEAHRYAAAAVEALDAVADHRAAVGLRPFAGSYLGWSLEHFAPGMRLFDAG